MKPLALLSILATALFCTAAAHAADEPTTWKIVAGKWDGGGTPPVWKLAAWPGKVEILASANGLYSTKDGGETWHKLGEGRNTPNGAGKAVQFVFDPKNKDVMWTSGMYQWGVWKTTDGGKSFSQVSNQMHVDGYAVDFSDSQRKVQLMGLHEQEHSLHKSTDGGATWVKIGDKIPQGSEFSTDPIIFDAKTYLINSCGWSKPGEEWGIYRTEDGGDTWTKVSKEGASGNPLVTSKGDIFWATQWGFELIKSSDQGKTWSRVKSAARGILEEVSPGILVGLGGAKRAQLYVSKDDGKNWTPFGDPLPFGARGFTYNSVRKCFVACAEKGNPGEVAVWNLSGGLDAAFSHVTSDVTVWDGEGFADGHGWIAPQGKNSLKPSSADHYNGKQSLECHVEGNASTSAGWNWADWQMGGVTDTTGFDSLAFYVKITGDKPAKMQVGLACGPDKTGSANVDIAAYTPDYLDGQWHQVIVPLKDLAKGKFDPKTTYEIRFLSNQASESSFNMYVDVVRFLKSPAK